MKFMDAARIEVAGFKCIVTRTGYTGEDGFEISVRADKATELAVITSYSIHYTKLYESLKYLLRKDS